MLTEVRTQFNIPRVDPWEDLTELLAPGEDIDWDAVRQEIETRLRAMPNVLPKELAGFQKMIEFQKTLPRRPKFTESTTHKLRIDVGKLYKGFKRLYDLTVDGLAVPSQKAIDEFYAAAADNLCDFLKTGAAKEVPQAWISVVQPVDMFGDKIVMVMANRLADPDEVSEEFQRAFVDTFGKRGGRLSAGHVEMADFFRMQREGMEFKDIVDDYIQRHRDEFPPDEQSLEYREARNTQADTLKHNLRNFRERLDALIGE